MEVVSTGHSATGFVAYGSPAIVLRIAFQKYFQTFFILSGQRTRFVHLYGLMIEIIFLVILIVILILIDSLNRRQSFRGSCLSLHDFHDSCKVESATDKPAQAPKNIPLISNNLHKFAKLFFARRRHFSMFNHLDFSPKFLCFKNLPPNRFSLPIFPRVRDKIFLRGVRRSKIKKQN